MERRMIIAVAVSLLILLAFQALKPKRQPVMQPTGTATSQQGPVVSGDAAQPVSAGAREQQLKETLTEINTDKYRLVFSDIGGALKELDLLYPEEKGGDVAVFNVESPSLRPFAMKSGMIPGLEKKRFELTRGDTYLEYNFSEPGWVKITKRYSFHKSFNYIDLQISIKNTSSRVITFSYTINGPADMKKVDRIMGRRFAQAATLIDGKIWKVGSVKGVQERMGDISWTALKSRYFAAALKPFMAPKTAIVQGLADKDLLTALTMQNFELGPGNFKEDAYLFYAGPLDEKELAAIGYNLQDLVDYGFFGGLSKALLVVLNFFHRWTNNWGLAIICLTILINIILFPLTFKSFSSMQKMKTVQPHMQKLKELHKDNPQKLNKEMMELYKQYKVNPLGGCLPLLLQMPIFIALYQGLMRFIGLKGSHFLWIKDLARPDAVPLPFSLPFLGASINILPLLMVGIMVLQQKISQGTAGGALTGDQASQQKMMMVMMPLFFGFLFYKMPSGLVLYWLTNTILMTAEQSWIAKRLSTG